MLSPPFSWDGHWSKRGKEPIERVREVGVTSERLTAPAGSAGVSRGSSSG